MSVVSETFPVSECYRMSSSVLEGFSPFVSFIAAQSGYKLSFEVSASGATDDDSVVSETLAAPEGSAVTAYWLVDSSPSVPLIAAQSGSASGAPVVLECLPASASSSSMEPSIAIDSSFVGCLMARSLVENIRSDVWPPDFKVG